MHNLLRVTAMKKMLLCTALLLTANLAQAQSPSLTANGSRDHDVQAALNEIEALKRDVATARKIVNAARRCGDAGELYLADGGDNCAPVELLRGLRGPKGDGGPAGNVGPIGPAGPDAPYAVCCGTCDTPATPIGGDQRDTGLETNQVGGRP